MNIKEGLMKKILYMMLIIALATSTVLISNCISTKAAAYYNIDKKAGGEGRVVKIGKTYFHYENRNGCGKAYRYYKHYTDAMLKKGFCPGDYFGKNPWSNGKKVFYIVKNRLTKNNLNTSLNKTKKLGSKKYKYKIKSISKGTIFIKKYRKHKSKTIYFSIKKNKLVKNYRGMN